MARGIKLNQQELNERNRQFEQGFHWCNNCNQFKPVADFAKNRAMPYGLHGFCRQCHKAKRDRVKKYNYSVVNKRNRRLALFFNELGGGCCQRCGYSGSIAALDFHHINPNEKEYNPAYIIVSGNVEAAKKELDKCVLICSNCHREYNAGLWRCEYVKRKDGLGWTIKRGSIVETRHDDIDDLPDRYKYTQLGFKV